MTRIYEKSFHLDSGVEMTDEVLIGFIDRHRLLKARYEELDKMYRGDHPILRLAPKPEYKPDHRLVVNYAKYIVDTFNGYFMGIPVKTTSDSDVANDYIQELEKANDIDDNNADLSKKCSIYGHAFELVFTDEEGKVGVTNIDPKECFLIFDNSIRERTLYGVRYRINKDNETEGTISDSETIRYFRVTGNDVLWEDEVEHFFGGVPIVEYVENEERIGAFEGVETLINAYNQAISEKANDVSYFADAYMKILGAELDEKTIEQIRDNRIINLPQMYENEIVVEFMEKPDADQTQENILNRLEQLIFHISMVANITDESFGTASGIAMRYKLQSMSNLAMTKERKFEKGFNQRFRLVANLPQQGITNADLKGINYTFSRNIPSNLKEEAEIARALQGIVSDEKVLELLSVVKDAKAEMERIEEETARLPEYDFELSTVEKEEPIEEIQEVEEVDSPGLLNGAQISSLLKVVLSVAEGEIPYEMAISILIKAFGWTRDDVVSVIGTEEKLKAFNQEKQDQIVALEAAKRDAIEN